ncbi:ISLre2 family transposase, partial [Weizmannia sp. CD-2023]|nr:ISLre2 family transposase [Weizmannia sp. CD-2023]
DVEAREIHSLSAGGRRASSLVPRCGVFPGSLFPQESRKFRAPQHPRYPSLYGNITSFPKITPSK